MVNTVTTTTTPTNTAVGPTATFYAACAQNNFADTYRGQIINGIVNDGQPYSDYYGSTVSSAYECCVNVFVHPETEGVWVYNPLSSQRVI